PQHCITALLLQCSLFSSFSDHPSNTKIYTLSLHDALPISAQNCRARLAANGPPHGRPADRRQPDDRRRLGSRARPARGRARSSRSEEHTSELQSRGHLVCRLLLEKKKKIEAVENTNKLRHA